MNKVESVILLSEVGVTIKMLKFFKKKISKKKKIAENQLFILLFKFKCHVLRVQSQNNRNVTLSKYSTVFLFWAVNKSHNVKATTHS